MTDKTDSTVGQPRRSSDSRPRPGSGTPSASQKGTSDAKTHVDAKVSRGDPKPSASWSPIDPGPQ